MDNNEKNNTSYESQLEKPKGSVNRYVNPDSPALRQSQLEKYQGSVNRYINPDSPVLVQNKIQREKFNRFVRSNFLDKEIHNDLHRDYKENPFLISQIFGDGDMLEVNDPKHPYKHYFQAIVGRPGRKFIERAVFDFEARNYIPTDIRRRTEKVEEYVYQLKNYHKKDVVQYYVTTCPHQDMDKIYNDFNDFFEPSKTIVGYRKKIPSSKTLVSYISEETLAFIYMLIGIEWIHTDSIIGLDLRKFTEQEVFIFRGFIKRTFKIKGFVARATDGNNIIIFMLNESMKFIELIKPYVMTSFYTKIGDGFWGAIDEINKGPAILKLYMEPIEIIKDSPFDNEFDEEKD